MYVYKAKLDRVVDGDTVDANIDLGFDISINKRIRLAGIDTPETRTRNKEEKVKGLASKSRLIELLKDGFPTSWGETTQSVLEPTNVLTIFKRTIK